MCPGCLSPLEPIKQRRVGFRPSVPPRSPRQPCFLIKAAAPFPGTGCVRTGENSECFTIEKSEIWKEPRAAVSGRGKRLELRVHVRPTPRGSKACAGLAGTRAQVRPSATCRGTDGARGRDTPSAVSRLLCFLSPAFHSSPLIGAICHLSGENDVDLFAQQIFTVFKN